MEKLLIHLNSEKKTETHRMISSLLWPWIKYYFHSGGCIWMMPGPSGKLETAIITELKSLERYYAVKSNIKLYTADTSLKAEFTGIGYAEDNAWAHYVGEIFSTILLNQTSKQPTAAWFDLCGPITEEYRAKFACCVKQSFAHGSIIFITAQARGIRYQPSINPLVYRKEYTDKELAMSIDSYIKQTVATTGTKQLVNCGAEWPHVYRRENRNYMYVVLGYFVIEK
jgi:hypothetical protein